MARYYCFVILILSTTILTLISSTSSAPPRALVTPSSNKPRATATSTVFRVRLSHVDNNNNRNLTKLERIASRVSRGKARLHRLNAKNLETPVRAGNGEFLMKLSIGTPAKEFSAIMDTGSDLVWTQCLPCTGCFDQDTPIFDPAGSSSFSKLPCRSSLCEALSSSSCGGDNDSDNKCDYFYAYGDDSTTEGYLATETFSFGDQSSNVSVVQGVGFGCGGENHGAGFGQAAGLVGLGRGPLSLVSQLQEPRFSYCMTSIGQDSDSTLIMGSLDKNDMSSSLSGEARTTGLVRNQAQPSFYYVELQDITVGGTRLGLGKDAFAVNKDGSGGMIIDSGTTITYLERQSFDAVRKELVRQMSELEVDDSGSQGLDLCFKLPKNNDNRIEVPRMVFHFKDADLELPAENYMIGDSGMGVACLAMGPSSGLSILGNVQQQNMLVVHDLQDETVSFVPTQCDKL